MSSKQFAAPTGLGHSEQPSFGLISPSPLDDMMFGPQSDFQFQGHDLQTSILQTMAAEEAEQQAADLSMGFQAVNSKQLPLTPASLSQMPARAFEDRIGNSEQPASDQEFSSILESSRKSSSAQSDESSQPALQNQDRRKKQRRDSGTSSKGDGKNRSREKNKIAAAKCRAKKRDRMDLVEISHRTLSAENSLLRKQEQQLRTAVAQLRTLALDHQSCSCGVHQYNMFEARKLAHGLGGICSMNGPHMTSVPDRRRKASDSAVHLHQGSSSDAEFRNRANSFSAFGMPSTDDFLSQNPMFGAEQGFLDWDPALQDHKLDS